MRTLILALLVALTHLQAAEPLRVAVFTADATPEIGMPAYVRSRSITDPSSARGVVLMGEGKPVVLCAVWRDIPGGLPGIGLANPPAIRGRGAVGLAWL